MDLENLFNKEAKHLRREAHLLTTTETPSGIVGYWGGQFKYPSSFSDQQNTQHILTLLSQAVPSAQRGLTAFQHEGPDDEALYQVCTDSYPLLEPEPLYMVPRTSLPPIQAICLHGSSDVERWLQSMGLSRMDHWKLPADLEDMYNDLVGFEPWFWWQEEGIVAVLNPWHVMWPDDEMYSIPPVELKVGTLRDAEPYLQIWHSKASQAFWMDSKIT
ncbi:hypothetical protein [Deinococcus cellulosilyticus]|uniref:Uncharacterized protein n=1 Tax=Deinococcus cellulosilyticus (strain DSM 18568 / NBRC 106333 / KACC 11606 / 5516J-15) TaxID=1223518 RepID=A0A511MWF7_DEIC1|nr:hypothetical protein [Deinococcus cellulosilyticus]GEM44923.1 hypothetical protein DC3_05580 [Deinococcus cellulosilyticus NBRC 106333 = KACC 11606]